MFEPGCCTVLLRVSGAWVCDGLHAQKSLASTHDQTRPDQLRNCSCRSLDVRLPHTHNSSCDTIQKGAGMCADPQLPPSRQLQIFFKNLQTCHPAGSCSAEIVRSSSARESLLVSSNLVSRLAGFLFNSTNYLCKKIKDDITCIGITRANLKNYNAFKSHETCNYFCFSCNHPCHGAFQGTSTIRYDVGYATDCTCIPTYIPTLQLIVRQTAFVARDHRYSSSYNP
jgi:hypothetical protein